MIGKHRGAAQCQSVTGGISDRPHGNEERGEGFNNISYASQCAQERAHLQDGHPQVVEVLLVSETVHCTRDEIIYKSSSHAVSSRDLFGE